MNAYARRLARALCAATVLFFCCNGANAGPDLTRMRAIHFAGNWGGNVEGIRSAVSAAAILDGAQNITAQNVQVNTSRSSFVEASGRPVTNDMAVIRLSNVVLGTTSLPQAGFWIARDVATGQALIQFRPSLDTTLSGIEGFNGDITVSIAADGSYIDTGQIASAAGTARDFVIAVLVDAGKLLREAAYTFDPVSALDRNAVLNILEGVAPGIRAQQDEYWDFLRNENVEWIGISVAMFAGTLADPVVRLKYRSAGDPDTTIYTFDDADLENFIRRARQLGFKILLTLAIEPSGLNLPPASSDPTCNTELFTVNRAFLGLPTVATADENQRCINPAFWWWDPAHPAHTVNVDQFWSSYSAIAVKYAELSQRLGVDIYSLGTETDRLFRTRPSISWNNHFRQHLAQMVAAVRAAYSGLVTYDQISTVHQHPEWFDGAEGAAHVFTDLDLDAVGISAYFELVRPPVARVLSVSELEVAWEEIFDSYLLPLQASNPGKPLLFTEFGYTDDVGSPAYFAANEQTPVPSTSLVTPGMQQQQNILQAFFNVNERHNVLVRGAFLWGNGVFTNYTPNCEHVGFNIHCKPSAQTVATIYANWAARDAERLFAWAEEVLPQYFPAGPTTQTVQGYLVRYYPATRTYLGIKGGRVIVHNGANWNLQDVGSVRQYLDQAAGRGF